MLSKFSETVVTWSNQVQTNTLYMYNHLHNFESKFFEKKTTNADERKYM